MSKRRKNIVKLNCLHEFLQNLRNLGFETNRDKKYNQVYCNVNTIHMPTSYHDNRIADGEVAKHIARVIVLPIQSAQCCSRYVKSKKLKTHKSDFIDDIS